MATALLQHPNPNIGLVRGRTLERHDDGTVTINWAGVQNVRNLPLTRDDVLRIEGRADLAEGAI